MVRLTCHRMIDLDRRTLVYLRDHLTNSRRRGDLRDDGSTAGSTFVGRINDHIDGEVVFKHDCWAIVASEHSDPVAWCMVTRRAGFVSHRPFAVPTADVGFYVKPSHRRTGLGSRLIEEACEVARANRIERLLAMPWNASSHAFFSANGFVATELDYHPCNVRSLDAA